MLFDRIILVLGNTHTGNKTGERFLSKSDAVNVEGRLFIRDKKSVLFHLCKHLTGTLIDTIVMRINIRQFCICSDNAEKGFVILCNFSGCFFCADDIIRNGRNKSKCLIRRVKTDKRVDGDHWFQRLL